MLKMFRHGPKSLSYIEGTLNSWLKPAVNAENWDNVGLLVGSGKYEKNEKMVSKILLCIDLTFEVLNEAIQKEVNMVVAYHPPIFVPLKSVGYKSAKELLIARCIAHDICVYSPHTALDSVLGGINDYAVWKLGGSPSSQPPPIPTFRSTPLPGREFMCTLAESRDLLEKLNKNDDVMYGLDFPDSNESMDKEGLDVALQEAKRPEKVTVHVHHQLPIDQVKFGDELLDFAHFKSIDADLYFPGSGRSFKFHSPVPIDKFIFDIKSFFNMDYVQVAYGKKTKIESVAFCAGSGGSVLKNAKVDIVITGEMSHHEVLEHVENGISVVLIGHSNSERFYLPILAKSMRVLLNVPSITISQMDISPLTLFHGKDNVSTAPST